MVPNTTEGTTATTTSIQDTEAPPSSPSVTFETTSDGSTVHIQDASYSGAAGTYECFAEFEDGSLFLIKQISLDVGKLLNGAIFILVHECI
jgi:hypothetical protein